MIFIAVGTPSRREDGHTNIIEFGFFLFKNNAAARIDGAVFLLTGSIMI